jgi:hypothetical protein
MAGFDQARPGQPYVVCSAATADASVISAFPRVHSLETTALPQTGTMCGLQSRSRSVAISVEARGLTS